MMIAIWGKEAVGIFCEINAFKYQMRMGDKGPIVEDYAKRNWYLQKAKELKNSSQFKDLID